jgi:hypothetical protein
MFNIPKQLKDCMIFPCIENSKFPATKNGMHDASIDAHQIEDWHALNSSFNWAVATGLSGLFVIDVDPKGLAYWQDLLSQNISICEAVASTWQVRTPRGGLHVYFKGEGPTTTSKITEGIDTRGGIRVDNRIVSGGYALLPGSKTLEGEYISLSDNSIIDLPENIKALIPARKHVRTLGVSNNPDLDSSRNVAWAVDLLTSYVAQGRVSVQGKGGDDTAYAVVASILDKAISPETCLDLLLEHWNPYCSPPWEDWELEQKIINAAAYGEDTKSGNKGIASNAQVFAAYQGEEFQEAKEEVPYLKWIHDYADGVKDPTWLIPGLLPSNGIGMLYGDSGSYKSFIALDIALTLAYGIGGQWNAASEKHDVLFLAGEGPIGTVRKRWPAWMDWQNQFSRQDHRFIILNKVPLYTDSEGWRNIKTSLETMGASPSLIVIDTLSRLLSGMDENSTEAATLITGFLEELARHYNCFVLYIHHTGKDKSRGARGSYVWQANSDTVISTRLRIGGVELKITKQKDADVKDSSQFFQVKNVKNSIVLERVDSLPDKIEKSGSRYDWASSEEVVKVLQSMGGSASADVLYRDISGRLGLELELVKKQLKANVNLTWLQVSSNHWAIPKQEYDL